LFDVGRTVVALSACVGTLRGVHEVAVTDTAIEASTCLVRGWRPDDVLAERRRRKQIRRHDRRHNVDARRGTSRRRYEAMA
jgi:hypothetical protein